MAYIFIDRKEPRENEALACLAETPTPGIRKHDRLWVIWRAPHSQFGHFMCFKINAEVHVIDASVPTHLDKIPNGAVEVPQPLAEKIWHCQCGSHIFGCCYFTEVAKLGVRRSGAGSRR